VRFNGMSPGESLVRRDELSPSKVRNPAAYRMRPLVKSIAPSARRSYVAAGTFRRFGSHLVYRSHRTGKQSM
jgi:hypothetical protein